MAAAETARFTAVMCDRHFHFGEPNAAEAIAELITCDRRRRYREDGHRRRMRRLAPSAVQLDDRVHGGVVDETIRHATARRRRTRIQRLQSEIAFEERRAGEQRILLGM